MSIAPGKIVTQDRDLYRVDGWLMTPELIPPDTNVPFELEMKCYKPRDWQTTLHQDAAGSCWVFDREGAEEAVKEAYEEYLKCRLSCVTDYCLSQCDKTWEQAKEEIKNQFGP